MSNIVHSREKMPANEISLLSAAKKLTLLTTTVCHSARCFLLLGPMWAPEHCRISPPHFLAECRMRRLKQASFVQLYFALFAFPGFCLVFVVCLFLICLLSSIFQRTACTNVNGTV